MELKKREKEKVRAQKPDIPPEFTCSITAQIMFDPVSTSTGDTYEREAIENWLKRRSSNPVTGEYLASTVVTPNKSLRKLIRDWLEKHVDMWNEVYIPKQITTDALHIVKAKNVNILKKFLKEHPYFVFQPLDDYGRTALHLVCKMANRDCLNVILESLQESRPANYIDSLLIADNLGKAPIHYAMSKHRNKDFLDILVNLLGSSNRLSDVPMFPKRKERIKKNLSIFFLAAAKSKNLIQASFYLRLGADVNTEDAEGTALHISILKYFLLVSFHYH